MSLNKDQFKEHLIGYHHTPDEESAKKIMSEGFSSGDGWSYFMSSPDPEGSYGRHVIEVAVHPKNVEIDENSPAGHPWQEKDKEGNWAKKVWMVAPNSDMKPIRLLPPIKTTFDRWSEGN